MTLEEKIAALSADGLEAARHFAHYDRETFERAVDLQVELDKRQAKRREIAIQKLAEFYRRKAN